MLGSVLELLRGGVRAEGAGVAVKQEDERFVVSTYTLYMYALSVDTPTLPQLQHLHH